MEGMWTPVEKDGHSIPIWTLHLRQRRRNGASCRGGNSDLLVLFVLIAVRIQANAGIVEAGWVPAGDKKYIESLLPCKKLPTHNSIRKRCGVSGFCHNIRSRGIPGGGP